ncbi:hypothetical protein EDB89DRAFT_2071350 [Lactarius sanguifluus]|nr:hypothetical protein EDB89DRAFT_2071350 [Lactarius sanguifluus]
MHSSLILALTIPLVSSLLFAAPATNSSPSRSPYPSILSLSPPQLSPNFPCKAPSFAPTSSPPSPALSALSPLPTLSPASPLHLASPPICG